MTFDGFPRIICSIRVGIDAGTEVHEGSSQREIAGGGRGSFGNVRATHLAFSAACAVSLPAPDPPTITSGRPPGNPGPDPCLPCVLPCARGCGKTYDVFDPRSRKVSVTLSALTYPPAPRSHEASKWQF